jgi:hypothetical protein
VLHNLGQEAGPVANELVSNVVEHAHTSSRLTITYTGAVLRVAVSDYCPCPAQSVPDPSSSTHPAAVDCTWWHAGQDLVRGRHPNGKTVWATLALDAPTEAEAQ